MFDRQIIFPLLEARPELFLLKSGAYHTYKRNQRYTVYHIYKRIPGAMYQIFST